MFFAIKNLAALEKIKDTLCVSFNIDPRSIKEQPAGSAKPKLLQVEGHEEEAAKVKTLLEGLGAV